jgi:hypothetical protein
MAKIQQEDALLGRITKREEEAQKRQAEIQRIEQEGRQKIEQDRNQARFLEAILGGGGRPASPGAPPIRVVERPDGTSTTTRTFRTEEERKAYEDAKAKESGNTGDLGPDPDYTKAARDAIKQFEALRARGVPAKLEIDDAGIPTVKPKTGFWDFSSPVTPETIDALRRKVEPQKKLTGRTPVPVFALPNMGANSVPTNVITR